MSDMDSSDFGRKNYGQVQLNYQYSTLDNLLYPRKGIRFNAGAFYTQNTKENEQHFTQVTSELATYISKGPLTIASRTGVSTNIGGSYEFFQANTLGGSTNLRGYRGDRFAGETSVYQNTELRWRFSNVNAYLVKGVWGVLAFKDQGRVWMPDEDSNKWHYGYGGGVWLLPFNRMALTATYGISKEDKLINIAALLLPLAAGFMARGFGRSFWFWFWFWISIPFPMIVHCILLCLPERPPVNDVKAIENEELYDHLFIGNRKKAG